MSWGSAAPSAAIGTTPVCTWEIQSNRMARILALIAESAASSGRHGEGSSSRNISQRAAAESSARPPRSLSWLPQRSSSSSTPFRESAAARARAPASPIALSRSESRLSAEPAPSTAAMASAPASPMPFRPRQSSPSDAFGGAASARATAQAPRSPRPMPLSSSSRRQGGARRQSRAAAAQQVLQRRARSWKDGRVSMTACATSCGRSANAGRPERGASAAAALQPHDDAAASAPLPGSGAAPAHEGAPTAGWLGGSCCRATWTSPRGAVHPPWPGGHCQYSAHEPTPFGVLQHMGPGKG
mmetsp:Transcript_90219/g.255724  ORF Transcript_90219/g.255724 Transcript_90219/m.255724 type:complete len:300 (-) Transcript_90219:304-1203(-)